MPILSSNIGQFNEKFLKHSTEQTTHLLISLPDFHRLRALACGILPYAITVTHAYLLLLYHLTMIVSFCIPLGEKKESRCSFINQLLKARLFDNSLSHNTQTHTHIKLMLKKQEHSHH